MKHQKVIYCSPLGGMNDTFCRIAACINHAQKFGRNIVIDSSRSGLMDHFDEFFNLQFPGLKVALRPNLKELANLTIFESMPLEGEPLSLAEFKRFAKGERAAYIKRNSIDLRPDLSVDHAEKVLYYEASGGGTLSHSLLPHLSLREEVRDWIEERKKMLPSSFVSVHLRSTDWMRAHVPTDEHSLAYGHTLELVASFARGLPVFIASDNPALLSFAEPILKPSAVISLRPRFALEAGLARHSQSNYVRPSDRREATLLSLFDLYALSGSSQFLFPSYVEKNGAGSRTSGFSRLAAGLFEDPATFESFFRMSRPGLLQTEDPRARSLLLEKVNWQKRAGNRGSQVGPSRRPRRQEEKSREPRINGQTSTPRSLLGIIVRLRKTAALALLAVNRRILNLPHQLRLPPVIVVSPGGVATTALLKHLSKWVQANSFCDEDGLKHLPRPPWGKSRILYLTGNSEDIRASISRRHWTRRQSAKLGSLRGVLGGSETQLVEFKRAVWKQEQAFRKENQGRVKVIHYDSLWEQIPDIARFFGIEDPLFVATFPAKDGRH